MDDDRNILALDTGGCWTKLGQAGEENPDHDIRTVLGCRLSDNQDASNKEMFIGVPEDWRDVTSLHSPIDRGVIHDWDAMEQIWDFLFYQKMEINPEIWQLVTAEHLLSPMAQTEKKAQIFFEKYNFPSLCVTDEGTMTMLTHGYLSALCVCIGDGTTTVSAVSDKFRVPSATQKLEMGGHDVTMYLQAQLSKKGYNFTTPGELELLREIKEKYCYVSDVPLPKETADTRVSYRDKTLITLPGGDVMPMTSEKWTCAEVLFDPSIAGLSNPGIHNAIRNCLNNVPINVKKELMERVVLTGGTPEMTGLSKRLLCELKKMNTYPGCEPRVIFTPGNSRNWIGLSIVGSLYNCDDQWVTKAEYDEFGPSYVRNKHSEYTYTLSPK